MRSSKPWYRSVTILGVAITAVSHFILKRFHHLPEYIRDILAFLGLIVTVYGRVAASETIGGGYGNGNSHGDTDGSRRGQDRRQESGEV